MEVLPLKNERNPYSPPFIKHILLQHHQMEKMISNTEISTSKKLQVMKLRNILFILAAITLGFASCSSESDILSEIDTPVNGLDEETVAVSFNLGKDLQTKADKIDPNPTSEEATIHNCVIAIFDHVTGTMLAKREFILNNGLTRSGNTYTTSNMETKAIPSDVIVVANCPEGYFDNVVTKDGFDKAVQAQMGEINTLTASNLIKVWESEDEYSTGIDLAVQTNRNIKVNLRQVAARVDMNLQLNLVGGNVSKYDAYFETYQIDVTNINYEAQLLNPSNTGDFKSVEFKWDRFNWDNVIWEDQNSTNKIETHTNIVIDSKGANLIKSFYTYENSDKDSHAVTLQIYGKLVVRNRDTQKIETESPTLRLITINGSENYIERGYLYHISGTINYDVKEKKITFETEYQVVDWEKKEIDIPAFS